MSSKKKFNSIILISLVCLIFSLQAYAGGMAPKIQRCKEALVMAKQGFPDEYAILGDCYKNGVHDEVDIEKAKRYWGQSAIQGSSYGALKLALHLLYEGEKDSEVTIGLLLLKNITALYEDIYAADSYYHLGLFFEKGIIFERNVDLAIDNYKKGSELGSFDSLYALSYIYSIDEFGYKDLRKASAMRLKGDKSQISRYGYLVISYEDWLKKELRK